MLRTAATLALVASATAYTPTLMSLNPSRRAVVQAGAAGAAAAPFLQNAPAGASMDKSARAPVITIFDHRGCSRSPKEYTGGLANTQDDQMCVKAQSLKIEVSEQTAAKLLQENLSSMFGK
uniref:Phycoerythrin alpha chain domain-containing protein n=1 Tax=Hanusia phi TaxID=3032 RepID=A0A7S0EMN0_9CRYP|mmetsp:Transcript_27150/g.61745  ORF Transcript_27150/g.61745 Transcript_27150/m.61745 type:complete len:121 (+) Transcript_27150:44-406(+)